MPPRLCAALLATLALLASAHAAPEPPGAFVVGYSHGEKAVALALVASVGAKVTGALDDLDALVVETTLVDALLSLRSPSLGFVEPDALLAPAGAQWDGAQWNGAQWDGAQWDGSPGTTPADGGQWGLEAVRAPDAWRIEPGHRSATLCAVDSGVDATHRDLAPEAAPGSYNAIDGTSDASDDAGHGTHIAGVAVAAHDDGWGISGVTDSRVLAVKVLSAAGTGRTSDLAKGMLWCRDHKADVVLLALSIDGRSSLVTRAIDALAGRNIVVVASAGNDGPCGDCVTWPARDPRVIAVAAVDRDGALAPFSSDGPQVAATAPGVGILSDFPGGSFAYGSGTSQAAAFVAGAATLLRERHPGLSPDDVRSAIVRGEQANRELDVAAALRVAGG